MRQLLVAPTGVALLVPLGREEKPSSWLACRAHHTPHHGIVQLRLHGRLSGMLSVQTQAQAAIHMLQARSRTRVGPANAFLLRGQTAGLAGSPHEGCIKLAGPAGWQPRIYAPAAHGTSVPTISHRGRCARIRERRLVRKLQKATDSLDPERCSEHVVTHLLQQLVQVSCHLSALRWLQVDVLLRSSSRTPWLCSPT